jgi:hypothetical protein
MGRCVRGPSGPAVPGRAGVETWPVIGRWSAVGSAGPRTPDVVGVGRWATRAFGPGTAGCAGAAAPVCGGVEGASVVGVPGFAAVPAFRSAIRSPRAIACMRAETSAVPAATRTGLGAVLAGDVETRAPVAGLSAAEVGAGSTAEFASSAATPSRSGRTG